MSSSVSSRTASSSSIPGFSIPLRRPPTHTSEGSSGSSESVIHAALPPGSTVFGLPETTRCGSRRPTSPPSPRACTKETSRLGLSPLMAPSKAPYRGEYLLEGDALVEHLARPRPQEPIVHLGIFDGSHHQHGD